MSKICNNCGAINADHTAYCGRCGAPFNGNVPVNGGGPKKLAISKNTIGFIGIGVAALILIIIVIFVVNRKPGIYGDWKYEYSGDYGSLIISISKDKITFVSNGSGKTIIIKEIEKNKIIFEEKYQGYDFIYYKLQDGKFYWYRTEEDFANDKPSAIFTPYE